MPFPGSFRLGRNLVFSAQVSFLFRILRVRGCIRGRALFFEVLSGRVGAVGRLHPYSISIGIVGGRAGRLRPCSLGLSLEGLRRISCGMAAPPRRITSRGTWYVVPIYVHPSFFSVRFSNMPSPPRVGGVLLQDLRLWPAVFPWDQSRGIFDGQAAQPRRDHGPGATR